MITGRGQDDLVDLDGLRPYVDPDLDPYGAELLTDLVVAALTADAS